MAFTSPTADWELCGDRFYRKIKLYDAIFDQDLELEDYAVTSASCAGAIGTVPRSSGCPKLYSTSSDCPSVISK